LAVLVRYAQAAGKSKALALLHAVFKTVQAMNQSKDAVSYWQAVNRTFLNWDASLAAIWRDEKLASAESIAISREESLQFLAEERERIMRLSREQAIQEVLKWRNVENKIRAVMSVTDNGLMVIGVQ